MNRLFVLRELQNLTAVVSFLTLNWHHFAREGKFLAVTVSFFKDKRSLEQNRRYFGPAVLGAIVEQAIVEGRRFGKAEWHYFFKGKFIGYVDLPFGGTRPMSSSDLSIEEFSNFMHEVESYAANELGVQFQ
jgi:hypothetical protein